MKIIYHGTDDVTYTQIARLDFSPGVDMTLNSLPVDTLSADIITPDTLERGTFISLKDDMDTLFAKYKLTKVQRVNRDTLRVEAMSALGLLDWWTVGAERINTTAGTAVQDLMTGLPKSGFMSLVPYTLPASLGAVQIDGFAPEQTARERLLWLCLCMGAWVQQSFCDGLIFRPVPDFSNYDYSQGTLIPPARTYMQPDVQLGDPVYEVQVEFIDSISTTEGPDMQSGTDEGGVTYYWNVGALGYRNPENVQGSEVKLSGVSLLNLNYQQPTGALIQALYQNRMEITAEIIDNGDIKPGDVVRVYTDEDKIYCGVVKQCAFTFGQQAKARLTVNAFPDALPIQIVRVLYTADGVPLGQRTEVFPEGDTWEIDSPEIDGYTPDSPSITGSTGGTYTVDYEAVPLHHIKIIQKPAVLEYRDGSSIDFRGLRVTAYDANGNPWTNGGQWPGGTVPASALEYSTTVASLEDAEEPLTYVTPSGGVIVDGVEIIGPVYSTDMSAVDTPTWDDVLSNYYELDENNKRYWVRAYTSGSPYTERYCLLPNGDIIVAAKRHNISDISGYTVNPNNPDVPYRSGGGAIGSIYNYTHDGKTVYYWINSASSSETPNPVLVKNTQNVGAARLAWYIMYMSLGDPYSGRQQIAVGVKNMTVQDDIFSIIVKSLLPPMPHIASIRVITPPTKTTYEDGETIDYTGMVVKAYDEIGNLYTDSTHPEGVIPIAELTLTQKADINQTKYEERVYTDLDLDVCPVPFQSGTTHFEYSYGTNKKIIETNEAVIALFYAENSHAQLTSGYHLIFASGQYDKGYTVYEYENDVLIKTTDITLRTSYTLNGKTVRYRRTGGPANTSIISPSDIVNNIEYMPGDDVIKKIAWAMIYGNIVTSSFQTLSIGYRDLFTTTEITVTGVTT